MNVNMVHSELLLSSFYTRTYRWISTQTMSMAAI